MSGGSLSLVLVRFTRHLLSRDIARTYAIHLTADGHVRLYRNYDPGFEQGPLQMVSAFRALSEVIPTVQGSGLVMDWRQSNGVLLIGGDSHVIKAWDAQTEFQGMVHFFSSKLSSRS
jgi:regulatory associated protein of mTOR